MKKKKVSHAKYNDEKNAFNAYEEIKKIYIIFDRFVLFMFPFHTIKYVRNTWEYLHWIENKSRKMLQITSIEHISFLWKLVPFFVWSASAQINVPFIGVYRLSYFFLFLFQSNDFFHLESNNGNDARCQRDTGMSLAISVYR